MDGQTAATQAQANWLGDGWSTPHSFIERSFKPCKDDPEGSAAPKSTPDECYDGPVLTLSLNGSSTSLVWDGDKKVYKPADDNGEVVEHVTGSGNGSGTYNTDYWTVTDRTGTVFTFGRNELPGWTSGKPATNSVDSEPVFSAHSGDPCYNATWADSWCTMAYRWNLDYVTDGNAYAVNGGHAPDQVLFTTGDRCLSGTCDPLNTTNAANWPDVPYDLNCTNGSSCLVAAPSF